jgi:hypothetical protein
MTRISLNAFGILASGFITRSIEDLSCIHMIEWDQLHEEEESKKQMLGSTKCGTVQGHSAREASGSLAGRQDHEGS